MNKFNNSISTYNHDIFIRLLCAILILCPVLGCTKPSPPIKPIEPNKYRNLVIVAAAMASISPNIVPDNPNPSPNNPAGPVRRHKDCPDCNYKGWLGDGQPRADCPDCDFNGDGNNDDPMSVFGDIVQGIEDQKKLQKELETKRLEAKKLEEEKKKSAEKKLSEQKQLSQYEFTEEELGLNKPEIDLQWSKNTKDAIDRSAGTKPILVVLSSTEPGPIWKNTELLKYIQENYIPLEATLMSVSTENAWASVAPQDDSVEKDGQFFRFKNDVFTILNPEGKFTTEATNTYFDVPLSPQELLTLLKSFNK